MATRSDPLHRYEAIHTSDIDEFEHRLIAVYGARGFELPHPEHLEVRGNFVQLQHVALGFGACGTAAKITFAENDFARLQFPLRGQGRTLSGNGSAIVNSGNPSLTSPGRPCSLEYGEDFEHLFLRVSSDALARKLTVLLEAPARHPLDFRIAEFTSPALLAGLRGVVDLLVSQLNDDGLSPSSLVLREIEQAAIVQLLFASRHNYSALLDGESRETSSISQRRAEDYIQANWNRPIMIEALAEVAGVSVRALFKSFQRTRGYSPMVLVRKIRLEKAHALLSDPAEPTSVGGVAAHCGFSNAGHFAKDYRIMFGETPLQTLNRSRLRT